MEDYNQLIKMACGSTAKKEPRVYSGNYLIRIDGTVIILKESGLIDKLNDFEFDNWRIKKNK